MTKLLELYIPLVGLVFTGFILGRILPATVPTRLGQFLFWVGVPISVVAFLRQADLSGQIWIAPAVAWVAILLGAALAWLWIRGQGYWYQLASAPTQGSLLLAAMVGNTGYIGYPVALAIAGQEYFAWALFFDLLGTTLGAYGLGVAIAARYGSTSQQQGQLAKAILINPTLWSFGFGLLFRQQSIPAIAAWGLEKIAWTILALSLILIGMRLSQLTSWQHLPQASISISIKMLLVPLIVGSSLSWFGLTGAAALIMVLQMAMPPAFATLVLAEAFNLDKDLTVTTLAVGTAVLLITLPLWLWLFQ